MKLLVLILFVLSLPQSDMTVPVVEHHPSSYTTTTDSITHKCPEGYEGHYVDIQPGFDFDYWGFGGYSQVYGSNLYSPGPSAYTICFKKEFMDKIRKNPELQSNRPAPPRPV